MRSEFNPTLVIPEALYWGDDAALLDRLEPDNSTPPEGRAAPKARFPYSADWPASALAEARATFSIVLEVVRRFHERGLLLTTGSDIAIPPWITPGVSLHQEMELLVRAGIAPLDVLTIATANGAKAPGILDDVGTIEAGKRADLVVLTADPVKDIRNTRRIESVLIESVIKVALHQDPMYFLVRGDLRRRLGDTAGARSDAETILRGDSTPVNLRIARVQLGRLQSRHDGGLAYRRLVEEMAHDFSDTTGNLDPGVVSLAIDLLALGENERAMEFLDRVEPSAAFRYSLKRDGLDPIRRATIPGPVPPNATAPSKRRVRLTALTRTSHVVASNASRRSLTGFAAGGGAMVRAEALASLVSTARS